MTEPWRGEPDFYAWIDKATGLRCRIVRHPTGHLCGYVECAEEPEDSHMIDVHGGITGGDREWIGFDCGHIADLRPYASSNPPGAVYRDFGYVTRECEKLAAELHRRKRRPSNNVAILVLLVGAAISLWLLLG